MMQRIKDIFKLLFNQKFVWKTRSEEDCFVTILFFDVREHLRVDGEQSVK